MEWPLLASLRPDERDALLAHTTIRHYTRGQTLVSAGDPSDSLHLIEAGRLAVRVSTEDGDEATLTILGPGECFGELSLLHDGAPARSATVVALEAARTRSLGAHAFAELRHTHRGADELLLRILAGRVEELSDRLVEAMYDTLHRRVQRRLVELVRMYATHDEGPVEIPLTQGELAHLVGGTRPSVNQSLQLLADQGVLSLRRGRITVLDPLGLDGGQPAGVTRRPGVTR